MAKTPANIPPPKLNHNQSRSLAQNLVVGLPALRRRFRPIVFEGVGDLLDSRRVTPALGDDIHRQGAIGESCDTISPARDELKPPCRTRARCEVALDRLCQG